tara:strand:+ start:3222 stop:5408 length:2187 start_codon:yes stop_codon:yes gene_type:complete
MGITKADGTTVLQFLNDNPKIPPYQRAAGRWGPKEKFLLLVSILSNFPVGAVVIHKEKGKNERFLMDGQQRREALNELKRFRPIFGWLDDIFKITIDDFEDKLRAWLLEEYLAATTEDEDPADFEYDPLKWDERASPEENEGKEFLRKLYLLRDRMGKRTSWKINDISYSVYPAEKKMFKLNFFKDNIEIPFRTNGEFDPEKMHKLFYEYMKEDTRNHADSDDFANFAIDNMVCTWKTDAKKDLFRTMISDNYSVISEIMKLSFEIKNRILNHELGQIEYEEDPDSTASQYDLPTIFRYINDGGTPLEEVELFASAGRWVGTSAELELDTSLEDIASPLILQLKIDPNFKTTKWHICCIYSQLFNRIGGGGKSSPWWVANPNLPLAPVTDTNSMKEGFKLFSLFHQDSVAKISWRRSCRIPATDDVWTKKTAIDDYSHITKVIMADPYFERLFSWGWSLRELSGKTATSFDVAAITAGLRQLWLNNGSPKVTNAWQTKKEFIFAARKYVDFWIYKNIGSSVITAGSADDKLTAHIKHLKEGGNHTETKANWEKLMNKIIQDGVDLSGDDYTLKARLPSETSQPRWARLLLAHIYAIHGLAAPSGGTSDFHVDHILSKDSWNDYITSMDEEDRPEHNHTNNLVNLCLLDQGTNVSKNAKALNHPEITGNAWIKQQITRYTGIEESEFSEYSSIDDDTHSKLRNKRESYLNTQFIQNRKKCFSNQDNWWV